MVSGASCHDHMDDFTTFRGRLWTFTVEVMPHATLSPCICPGSLTPCRCHHVASTCVFSDVLSFKY